MVGSKAMNLLSRDSGHVGGIARPDVVGVEEQFHATTWKIDFENYSKTLSDIQLLDVKLWIF